VECDRCDRSHTSNDCIGSSNCRYRWRPGTLGFWDNRATMHYGIYDYGTERRVMHRVTLRGVRPSGVVPIA